VISTAKGHGVSLGVGGAYLVMALRDSKDFMDYIAKSKGEGK
jgi:hypothetical protein